MEKKCNDNRCAEHGGIRIRGNIFVGRVRSAKPQRTVIVEREVTHYVPKYERYKKTLSRIAAHNPDCISAKEGDIVRIGETRKLSKTKSFVVMGIEGHKEVEEREEGDLLTAEKEKKKEEEKKEPAKEKQTKTAQEETKKQESTGEKEESAGEKKTEEKKAGEEKESEKKRDDESAAGKKEGGGE